MARYRNKVRGYCGKNTGPLGEGEHVVPKCLYPETTDPRIQRIKIPSCPDCNNSWEADEAHFKTMLAMCGPNPTPAQAELWQRSLRGFDRGTHGLNEVHSISKQLVSSPILDARGHPFRRVFPHKDPRVVRVLKKVVRGLAHFQTGDIVADDRVSVLPENPPFPAYQHELTDVFSLPEVFIARAFFPRLAGGLDLHSTWLLEFFGAVRFYGLVEKEAKTD